MHGVLRELTGGEEDGSDGQDACDLVAGDEPHRLTRERLVQRLSRVAVEEVRETCQGDVLVALGARGGGTGVAAPSRRGPRRARGDEAGEEGRGAAAGSRSSEPLGG